MVNRISPLTRFRSATENRPPPTNGVRSATPIALNLPHGTTLYPTALELPPNLALDAWEAIGAQLAKIGEGLQWALGDWWVYGFHKYGARKAMAKAKSIPYEFESLMNLGSVARQVTTSLRNEALSFSHHTAVARLEPEDQKKWLAKAARGKWSVQVLRRHMNERKRDDLGDRPDVRAHDWAVYLTMQAQRARNADQLWDEDDPRLDHLTENAIAKLDEAVSAAADIWTNKAKGLKQYRQKRLAKGASFKPRPLEPNSVPRVGNGVYDYNGDLIDERQPMRANDTATQH